MHLQASSLFPLLLATHAAAHFQIISPSPRGYDEDMLVQYPCGGQNTPSSNRTMFPLAGGPVQLNMEHEQVVMQVNIAVGSNDVDGSAFNTSVVPIFLEQGIGKFCLGDVSFPGSLNLKDGDNVTIQVITNGDPSGGLFNCADVTLSDAATPGQCSNGTGVKAATYSGSSKDANMSSPQGGAQQPSSSASTSSTASPSPSASKSAAAMSVQGSSWSSVVCGVLSVVILGSVGGVVLL